MAPPDLNDPAMHTTFHASTRTTSTFATPRHSSRPSGCAREREWVSWCPAAIAYLLFGGVPGFVVFRYVLALARGGADLPLRAPPVQPRGRGDRGHRHPQLPGHHPGLGYRLSRLGRGLVPDRRSGPPAMPSTRRRTGWLIGAAVLFTLAVWALATSTGVDPCDACRLLARPAQTRPAEAVARPVGHGRRRRGGHRVCS